MLYKFKLLKLHCHLSDESDGDEIFILMNGQKVWPVNEKYQTVKAQETILDLGFEVNKGDEIDFELWDYDLLSKNDLLGRLKIIASAHGKYVNDFIKTGDDHSRYSLEYEFG